MKAPWVKWRVRLVLFSLSIAIALVGTSPQAMAGNGSWTLVGWNNLGMHCMDDNFSVFCILPPYNTVEAQLINASGQLVTGAGAFSLTYQGTTDLRGSLNTTSEGKTNFWNYVTPLFGANLSVNQGLAGNNMPGTSNTPQALTFNSSLNSFEGLGIPIVPTDDAMQTNTYPMMHLVAKNGIGTVLAEADVVLPVSTEMDCRACHSSTSGTAAMPSSGWITDSNPSREYRLNILKLHDEKNASNATYTAALSNFGYDPNGLYVTATSGTPILCANCHASEALGTGGFPGVNPLTAAVHSHHASVLSPVSNLPLDAVENRSACYECHPGGVTRCLRGAMGSAIAQDGTLEMQCQSCHGNMSQVGAATRTGWLDEPNCQACHTGDAVQNAGQIRFTNAFDTPGHLRQALNQRFATNADTPAAGKSLFRFSHGHGGLMCQACHGTTHAEYPSSEANDNQLSKEIQGHTGVLIDCTGCHATQPGTITGGPHGMHPTGQSWVSDHGSVAENSGLSQCRVCHGTDSRGTVLSVAHATRNFQLEDFGQKSFFKGSIVSCYSCHNGPGSESAAHAAPVAKNLLTATQVSAPGSIALKATSPVGIGPLKYRVITQPLHGTVGVSGATATYYPASGFKGGDSFTYAANDGFIDSNLATVTVQVNDSGTVVHDATPPKVRPLTPANYATVPSTFTVSGTASDNKSLIAVQYKVGGGSWANALGTSTWYATVTNAPPGLLKVKFRAKDGSGNLSVVKTRYYHVR